jgi:hypothetical protein
MFFITGTLIGMALASGWKLIQDASMNPLVMPSSNGARLWITISAQLGIFLTLIWLVYSFFSGGFNGVVLGLIGFILGAAISGAFPIVLRIVFAYVTIPLIILLWVFFQ